MKNREVTKLRQVIDEIDQKLIDLLLKRSELSAEIGKIKIDSGEQDVFAPYREAEIIDKLSKIDSEYISESELRSIFFQIVSSSRSRQAESKFCILGESHGWIHSVAIERYGDFCDISVFDNINDFFENLGESNHNKGFVAVTSEHAFGKNEIIEQLMAGNYHVVEELNAFPAFAMVSNRAKDLVEVDKICITNEVLRLFSNLMVSMSYNLKVDICRSMSEVIEELVNSPNPVAAIVPFGILRSHKDFVILKKDLSSEMLGAIKFFTLAKRPLTQQTATGKTLILCAMEAPYKKLLDLLSIIQKHKAKICDIQTLEYNNKPWKSVLCTEILTPKNSAALTSLIDDLQKHSSIARIAGSYPCIKITP